MSLYIELGSLGEALRPGKVLEYVPAGEDVDAPWFRFCDYYRYRASDLEELAAHGADGRISDLAAAIAAAAPEGQAAVLARLGRELDTQVVIPRADGDLYATLYWSNGFIEADVSMPGRLEAHSRKIELRATLPHVVMSAMIGRPLGDVVELPFALPTPVGQVHELNGGWLRISLSYGYSLVNCGTGAVWPDPEA